MTKKILFMSLMIALCVGCKTKNGQYSPCQKGYTTQSTFNQEKYVWENFIFTTNKVEKVK